MQNTGKESVSWLYAGESGTTHKESVVHKQFRVVWFEVSIRSVIKTSTEGGRGLVYGGMYFDGAT